MATIFYGSDFFGGEFFNDGTDRPNWGGKGDNKKRGVQKLHLPFKPTGILARPKAKDARVQERLDDAVEIQAQIAGRLAIEFGDESQRIDDAHEAKAIVEMSMAEVDREIGILLQKKLRTEEDEMMLMLLMVAASA